MSKHKVRRKGNILIITTLGSLASVSACSPEVRNFGETGGSNGTGGVPTSGSTGSTTAAGGTSSTGSNGNGGGSSSSGTSMGCTGTDTLCDGACVDTSKDDENCGRCGHSCLGGQCVDAKCQPFALVQGEAYPWAITADKDNLYWTNYTMTGTVKQVPKKGGVAAKTLANSATYPAYGVAVDATYVYFTLRDLSMGVVYRVNKDGQNLSSLATNQSNPVDVVPYNNWLYWANQGDATIKKVAIAGLSKIGTVATGQGAPPALTTDGTDLYWTTGSSPGQVMKTPLSGGSMAPISVVGGLPFPKAIAVDAKNIYWTNQGTTKGDGSVMRMAKNGVKPIVVADNQPNPTNVAVDDKNIYWVTNLNGTIMSAPIAGGVATALVTNQNRPYGIVVDASAIYWTNSGTGTSPDGAVVKLAK